MIARNASVVQSPVERYLGHRLQFDLAIRMIGHEARTLAIRQCTGLSEDRIRKLYATYFKAIPGQRVRRHRGKSPASVSFYVKSARRRLESSTLAVLFMQFGLAALRDDGHLHALQARGTPQFGLRFCEVYETFCDLHRPAETSFERGWTLFDALTDTESPLVLSQCDRCEARFVLDQLEINSGRCPACALKLGTRRR